MPVAVAMRRQAPRRRSSSAWSPAYQGCRSPSLPGAAWRPPARSPGLPFHCHGNPTAAPPGRMFASASRPASRWRAERQAGLSTRSWIRSRATGSPGCPSRRRATFSSTLRAIRSWARAASNICSAISIIGKSGDQEYVGEWALSRDEERRGFERFIDFVTARQLEYPDLHIYHFAPYEPGALKRLMGRYATREEALDRILRALLFVDLYAVVRHGIRASVESYSIKELEPSTGFSARSPCRKPTGRWPRCRPAWSSPTRQASPASTRQPLKATIAMTASRPFAYGTGWNRFAKDARRQWLSYRAARSR